MALHSKKRSRFHRSLLVVLTEDSGACYLSDGRGGVSLVAEIHIPCPDHSDIEWFVPSDTEPDPVEIFRQRFFQYAGAIVTAVARSSSVEFVFVYGRHGDTGQVLRHIPVWLRERTRIVRYSIAEELRGSDSQRIHNTVVHKLVRTMPSPFSSVAGRGL